MSASRGPNILVPPPFVYVAVFLAGWGLQQLTPTWLLPEWSRPAGTVVGLLGLALAFSGFGLFVALRTPVIPVKAPTRLVRSGPYRFTRNPMYLGLLVLYVGVALFFRLVWPLVLAPLAVVLMNGLVIKKEEAYLERAFGEEYARFKREVRRWV